MTAQRSRYAAAAVPNRLCTGSDDSLTTEPRRDARPLRASNGVMTIIAASLAIAMQNPAPADLKVPEGWTYHMSGYGTGSVVGPEGQTVFWPGYSASGHVAHVYYELDPSSVPLRAVVGGLEAYVTVCPDGRIAVSYSKRAGASYGGGFDYWMKPRSVREAVQLVALCLTRPAVMREKYPADAELPLDMRTYAKPSKEFPFSGLGGWVRTPYRRERRLFELDVDETVVIGGTPPSETKWTERATVMDFTLTTTEGKDGRLYVLRTGGGAPKAVAVASKLTAPSAVLAMLAALTYQELKDSTRPHPEQVLLLEANQR
jgi:hypothetical protein